MNPLVYLLIILASFDFLLTLIWVHRWRHSKYVRQFKHKIPMKLIEANPIIVKLADANASIHSFFSIFIGYAFVFLIQLALLSLHWILAFLVIAVLVWAITIHIRNNIRTTNRYIIQMTIEYNKAKRSLLDSMDVSSQ